MFDCNLVLAAYILDLLLGDPAWFAERWHPVVGIGWLISAGEGVLRRYLPEPDASRERLAGIGLCLGVIGITYCLAAAMVSLLEAVAPWLGTVVSVLLIYSCFSARSLGDAAQCVKNSLARGDIPKARQGLRHLVGRDVDRLDEEGVVRAAVESVAESTVDGFIAPLFYAVLGGAPLVLAYKAVNTLDSMVGYTTERYLHFGWASAKLDDLVNFIPARLMYLLVPAVSGPKRAAHVFQVMLRDGQKHDSPNSGISEAGFAAYLGVELGGLCYYEGEACPRPTLGDDDRAPELQDIGKAISIMYRITVLAVSACLLLWFVIRG